MNSVKASEKDPRSDFLRAIDIEKSRVQFESPHIFVCGGEVDIKSASNLSFRNLFFNRAGGVDADLADSLFRAEEFKDWLHDGTYPNLSDFESDLAGISRLIVLILEAPGALVELGMLAQIESFCSKLCVVVPNVHSDVDSFINLGALRRVKEISVTHPLVYDWDDQNAEAISSDTVDHVLNDIKEIIEQLPKTEKFSKENSHRIILVFKLIKTFIALKEGEISEFFDILGLHIEKVDLRRSLYCLERLNLIKKENAGNRTFFVGFGDFHDIRFSYKEGYDRTETSDMTLSCSKYYNSNTSERHRKIAIQRCLQDEK